MKKTVFTVASVAIFSLLLLAGCGKLADSNKVEAFPTKNEKVKETVKMNEYSQFQDFFTPAFQLIWNDFSDKVIGHKVEFVDGNPKIVEEFNQKRLTDKMLSEKDYYKTIAPQTYKTKKTIEKELKKKFNEKSQLLDRISWLKKDDKVHKVLYCMFKKDVYFPKVFEQLPPAPFVAEQNSSTYYKMFGTMKNQSKFSQQVVPIYYNDKNDYAVRLLTKTGDEIILMTLNSDEPVLTIWDNLYSEKLSKNDSLHFDKNSKLLVPFIDFKKEINYNELTGKPIVDSNIVIDTALEVIEFSLDNTGAKIKNEAMMGIRTTALRPHEPQKLYYFNKPFVLFIRSKDGNVPYFAMKIKDTQYLKKS